jgi:hypothetical protein
MQTTIGPGTSLVRHVIFLHFFLDGIKCMLIH